MKEISAHRSGVTGHILLVDDNRHGLVARKTLLEEQGHLITTATNGEEALEAFSKAPFDLIVTDFRMPKMSGLELIVKIRKTHPEVPIILVSGLIEALGLDEKSTGADVVIQKDTHEVSHLMRAASRLLSKRTAKKPPASQRSPRSRAKGAQ